MKIKAVLFDLDGTLLPMDQDLFIKSYFKGIGKKLAGYGYESEKIVHTIWASTIAMIKNNGTTSNEELFWKTAQETDGKNIRADEPYFNAFYEENFDELKSTCGYTPKAKQVVDILQKKGYTLALATNPVFPRIATHKRIGWAGLDKSQFALVTTYENSRYCKPNPAYYLDIVKELGVQPTECLMVGNDVREDMIAESLGMKVFLLTDCLINRDGKDISLYPNGNFDDLLALVENL